MESLTAPKRFALLVGVDFYQNNNARQLPNGRLVSLRHLEGAVNDVKIIKDLLQNQFQFDSDSVCTLTSSASPNDSSASKEQECDWATYKNIEKAFKDIHDKASSGDIFFFHFSGHGASLETTPNSPQDGRQNDLSLMTADYCCGRPAIRGWELNKWLWKFCEKGVRVIVLLDSCYSGGAWRAGSRFRSPDNWTPPPNLQTDIPADEPTVPGTVRKPGHRDGDLDECWDLNPRDLTLMTACKNTEKASETSEGTKVYGAFTLALMKYFQNLPNSSTPTYHAIYDYTTNQLGSWDLSQKPQVFGKNRLAFLEDYELISVTPIFGTVEGGIVSLPVGKIHCINRGSEFITVSMGPSTIFSVSELYDLESKAKMVKGSVEDPSQPIRVIPYRWSSEKALNIIIDPKLERSFREKVISHLGNRIASNIQYTEGIELTTSQDSKATWLWLRLSFLKQIFGRLGNWVAGNIRHTMGIESTKNEDSEAAWFQLGVKADGGIEIFGPKQVLGYQGPVRGWKTSGGTDDERAKESAIALAHLFRFGQIVQLQNRSEDTAPFEVTINPQPGKNPDNGFDFTFENNDDKELYFAILILSPGFHVKQLFPLTDTPQLVPPRGIYRITFSLTLPDKLKRDAASNQRHEYRDIIRTVVTTGMNVSLKSMELPDIWNADQWDNKRADSFDRDGNLLDRFGWWVHDEEKFTK